LDSVDAVDFGVDSGMELDFMYFTEIYSKVKFTNEFPKIIENSFTLILIDFIQYFIHDSIRFYLKKVLYYLFLAL